MTRHDCLNIRDMRKTYVNVRVCGVLIVVCKEYNAQGEIMRDDLYGQACKNLHWENDCAQIKYPIT